MSIKEEVIKEYTKNGGSYDRVSKVVGCTAQWVARVIQQHKKDSKLKEFELIVKNSNK